MRLGFASTFIGAGIAIIAMVLPMIWEDPPEWVLLVLLSLGGLLFLVGVLTLAWALIWRGDERQPVTPSSPNMSVTSRNQRGGVTAYQVNIGNEKDDKNAE
ncbi:MAG: hypothetical protein IH957_01455 [Chloroflexi bacterium]|nr:hypothetical protein [Chloroflexota bacterium]